MATGNDGSEATLASSGRGSWSMAPRGRLSAFCRKASGSWTRHTISCCRSASTVARCVSPATTSRGSVGCIPAANADIARMIAIELRKFPPPQGMSVKMMEDARLGPNVRPLIDDLVGDIGKSLWVVMATIGIVLLIACANVANLLLVRTEGRAQELAVRAALGAGRGRLAREMLVESLLLGLLGGAAGVGLAVG